MSTITSKTIGLAAAGLLCWTALAQAAEPACELKVNDAAAVVAGLPAALRLQPGAFGPGRDGAIMDRGAIAVEVRFTCRNIAEDDYGIGLIVLDGWYNGYLAVGEFFGGNLQIYLNDTRLKWTGHTEPLRALGVNAQGAPEATPRPPCYQAEMRIEVPVHLKAGDVIRIVGGPYMIGPLRLYRDKLPPSIVKYEWVTELDPIPNTWLYMGWTNSEANADSVSETCWILNPGVTPRTFTLTAEARDYLMTPLLDKAESITLKPGETIARTFTFTPGHTGRARLSVAATAPDVNPGKRLAKFYVDDRPRGPRPRLCLNGDWEMCPAPGVAPSNSPPPDAQWKPITVPSLQPNTNMHCAWYRKTFDAPAYVQGERIVLKCDRIHTEAWFYLNGQAVGHQRHGTLPFEVDLTAAFKPGRKNELLVAVRDWLAYSPKNADRVLRGEPPAFKNDMIDVIEYTGAANLGIGGPVWIEARPAVSVSDVFVVTRVREKKLTLRYRLANAGPADQDVKLVPRILDAGKSIRELPVQTVRVPAGSSAIVTVEQPWKDAQFWWPDDPHLYVLQTTLTPSRGAADTHIQRFGFRELWIDGCSFVLNGTRTKIRSQWCGGADGGSQAGEFTDPAARCAAIWNWQRQAMHDWMVQLTRISLCNAPGQAEAIDIADESGLMIKLEGEVAQVNFTFDETYWKAAIAHEQRMVDIFKSHASIVIWSAGNENMWGMIYQGDAAKTLGNKWQIKIMDAIRAADLQGRPVEWEADGDLFGGAAYYALHYPRELISAPDVPNSAWWGRLDGKITIPYSMGPITLGSKPLTVGECHWPAALNRPYGPTILLGDNAYLGGNYWVNSWYDSSRYFLNAMRDAEFALIDTYLPMQMLKPQTIVLKEETSAFFGGRSVTRELNIHNDIRTPARLAVRWTVSAPDGRTLVRGGKKLSMAPAELRRLTIKLPLPRVAARMDATFRVELLDGNRVVHADTRAWQIYPAQTIRRPDGLLLAVYDPAGDTAQMLKRGGIRFTRLDQLAAPASGALLIGRDALRQPPQGPWRETLSAFVRGGGKVAILEQTEAPDFLPVALMMTRGKKTTLAFVRAEDHPVMSRLRNEDLRWWPDDHYVCAANYRKPQQGNWLPLADIGSGDGTVESPLLEAYEGRGSYLLCQFQLTDKVGVAPQAGWLLQNLLDYLARPDTYRVAGKTALFAAPDSRLRKALDDSRLVFDDLTGKPDALKADLCQLAVVDMATAWDPALTAPLRAFAQAGGRVLLHRAKPDQQAQFEQLLGIHVRFFPVKDEPSDIRNHVLRMNNSGLLAGISNHDFYWASPAYLECIRHEGVWWSGWWSADGKDFPEAEQIADFYCWPADDSAAKVVRLTRPAALLEVPIGKGAFIVSQLRIDEAFPGDVPVVVSRLRSLLLTNLGGTLQGSGSTLQARARRLQQYQYTTIDLGPYANRGLQDVKEKGIVGWTNQGENDVREMPTGRQTFDGIPFFIATPKSVIALYSPMANNVDLPKEVAGIKIGMHADALFFMHTTAWGGPGKPLFRYIVHYDDGTQLAVPIFVGQELYGWWEEPDQVMPSMVKYGAFVAWKGSNPMVKSLGRWGIMVPGYEWPNPHPEKPIRAIDFVAAPESGYGAIPVLVAITAARTQTDTGVATDVIGTQGLKVKLGNQEKEIYYIGVTGIGKANPFYDKAVAAHQAVVVGKKVRVQYDVVRQNSVGQTIAYVLLSDENDNMVNGRIIGDGLGALGNFEGNNQQRMYLENLGFIAKQGKKGMWASDGK